ncbi:MAG: VOC family protein [Verrucomicrobium sp.]|nr:VOC family protein [Verrucomicrobium sp.]
MSPDVFGGPPRHHHAALSVSNLDAAAGWYGEMLGFQAQAARRLELPHLRAALLQRDGFRLELIELYGSEASPLAWQEPDAQMKTRGYAHYAFQVADLDATIAALQAKGARFACEPGHLPALGIRYVHIFDLDGNLVEFAQELGA